MNEKDIIVFPQGRVTQTKHEPSRIRAKSFRVNSGKQNYAQYVSTVKAYVLAGMPFEHIANAGEQLGDEVERGELDAPLQEGWEAKVGETVEDESKILSWQNRGEVISVTRQIASPNPVTGQEVVQSTRDLATGQNHQQNLNVLEGIAVFNNPQSLPNASSQNQNLENNPFLNAPADLKKAT